jgi:hypothetical protein
MLMRSEPLRELDRFTEAMLIERQARQIPIDAYRRGNEFTVRRVEITHAADVAQPVIAGSLAE